MRYVPLAILLLVSLSASALELKQLRLKRKENFSFVEGLSVTRRGDEVAIMHAQNVKVHTDRRLFLADVDNQGIRSVKLDYHTQQTVALNGIEEKK